MSVLQAAGKTPIQIAAWLAVQRHRKGIVPPNLTGATWSVPQKGPARDPRPQEDAESEAGAQVKPSPQNFVEKVGVRV